MKLRNNPQWLRLASAGAICAAALLVVGAGAKPAKADSFGLGVNLRIGDVRIGARYDNRDRYCYPNSYPVPVAVPAPYPAPYPVPAYPSAYPNTYPVPAYPNTYPYSTPYPGTYPNAYPVPEPYPYSVPVPVYVPPPVVVTTPYPYGGGGYGRYRNDCNDWRYRRR